MLTARICSIIIIIIILGLLLLLAAYHHHHQAPLASVGFYGGCKADLHSSSGVGDDNHLDNLILRRRKLIATSPHTSPSSPRNYRLRSVNGRGLLGTSLQHEDRPPSPGIKSRSLDGTSDDVTKKNEVITSSGGKHNHDQYGLAPSRSRRRRRLIAAGPSDSQPSPGYRS